jgi:hypothetical protein
MCQKCDVKTALPVQFGENTFGWCPHCKGLLSPEGQYVGEMQISGEGDLFIKPKYPLTWIGVKVRLDQI